MQLFANNMVLLFIILVVWVLPWKGYALWTAARMGHKIWFIALIILNTFAILDIIYIFAVAKKKPRDFFNAFRSKL